MAKKERNKRAARKARQKERARVEAAQAAAASGVKEPSRSLFKGKQNKKAKTASKTKAVAKADRKGMQRVTGYFADVRSEMRQVTWPNSAELRNYSVAVIASLLVCGFVLWLVDTGIVAVLIQYTGLRG